MRALVGKCCAVIAYFWKRRRLHELKVGRGTDVYIWRIGGSRECRLSIGEDCYIRTRVIFEKPDGVLSIGNRTFIGKGLIAIACRVSIGDDVMMAWGVTVVDHDSHSVDFEKRAGDTQRWLQGIKDWSTVKMGAVTICNKAWIGFNVSVLKGVTIGEGAVIAAASVVTKDVPAWTLSAGNPAKVIRQLR